MYGAILGDIVGSRFEFDNGGWTKDFELLTFENKWTDDTVMTVAVAEALMEAGKDAPVSEIEAACIKSMQKWGQKYPYAGYGSRFIHWVSSKDPRPYGSYGNGSAMRVSPVGLAYDTLERTREVARATAVVSHNHPEGIKGAECTAAVMYLARTGATKEEIADYVIKEFGYDFSESLEAMRARHEHLESCQDSLPKALRSFMDGESYEDVVRNAVSLGGDTDTLAAIAGAMGEAFFDMPFALKEMCLKNVKPDMFEVIRKFDRFIGRELNDEKEEYIDNAPLAAAFLLFMEEEDDQKRVESFYTFLNMLAMRISEDATVPMPFVDVDDVLHKELERMLLSGDEESDGEKPEEVGYTGSEVEPDGEKLEGAAPAGSKVASDGEGLREAEPDMSKVAPGGKESEGADRMHLEDLDIEQIKARLEKCDTLQTEEEVRLRMDTMIDDESGLWLPMFINRRELDMGRTANVIMPVPIMDILKAGLEREDLKGVVINPFSRPFTMPKELLRKFIGDYEAYVKKEGK